MNCSFLQHQNGLPNFGGLINKMPSLSNPTEFEKMIGTNFCLILSLPTLLSKEILAKSPCC